MKLEVEYDYCAYYLKLSCPLRGTEYYTELIYEPCNIWTAMEVTVNFRYEAFKKKISVGFSTINPYGVLSTSTLNFTSAKNNMVTKYTYLCRMSAMRASQLSLGLSLAQILKIAGIVKNQDTLSRNVVSLNGEKNKRKKKINLTKNLLLLENVLIRQLFRKKMMYSLRINQNPRKNPLISLLLVLCSTCLK